MLNFQQNGKIMKNFLTVLKDCPLFFGIEGNDVLAMLDCMGAKPKTFDKGQNILTEGDKADKIGILLDGQAEVTRVDYGGNKSIISTIHPSDLFAEAFACSQMKEMPVSVTTTQKSVSLMIDVQKIMTPCHNACNFHNKTIFNLLKAIADKNLNLNQKIEVTSKRTTRDKLLTYIMIVAKSKNSNRFCIPYDRQGLADYLEVDRSGLSAEISKLKKDGIIDCHKNTFAILREDDV